MRPTLPAEVDDAGTFGGFDYVKESLRRSIIESSLYLLVSVAGRTDHR